jgi:hypothetical protein
MRLDLLAVVSAIDRPTRVRVRFDEMPPGTYSFRLNLPVNLIDEGGKLLIFPLMR